MYELVEVIYKYGSEKETNNLDFKSKKLLNEYVDSFKFDEDEPQPEDFCDFDNPSEDYEYYHRKWLNDKNATKDDVKWFVEFYYKGKFIGGNILDC